MTRRHRTTAGRLRHRVRGRVLRRARPAREHPGHSVSRALSRVISDPAVRRAPCGRGRHDVRRRATTARSPSTSTTSSTQKRSCCWTGRTRSPGRTPSSGTATTSSGHRSRPSSSRLSRCSRPPPRTGRSRSSGISASCSSLRVVGVRDWRVYGVFVLWPEVIGEIRVSHLTPFLCLLVAIAWRYRDARFTPGLAHWPWDGDQVLPLAPGVWLAAIGQARETLRRGRRRRRVAPPSPAVHVSTTTCGR